MTASSSTSALPCGIVTAGGTPSTWQSLQPVVPLVLFLAVNRLGGLRWAVAIATIWALKVVIERRKRGQTLGRFIPVVTAAVLVRGAVGIATNSEAVYFGLGIAGKFVAAIALFISAAVGRPLGSYLARHALAIDSQIHADPGFARAMRLATVVAGLYYLLSGAVDVWLFQRSSIEGFVVFRFLMNWPLGLAALGTIYRLCDRALDTIDGAPALAEAIESQLANHTLGQPSEHPSDPRPPS